MFLSFHKWIISPNLITIELFNVKKMILKMSWLSLMKIFVHWWEWVCPEKFIWIIFQIIYMCSTPNIASSFYFWQTINISYRIVITVVFVSFLSLHLDFGSQFIPTFIDIMCTSNTWLDYKFGRNPIQSVVLINDNSDTIISFFTD